MYLLTGGPAYGVSYLKRDDDGPGLNSRITRWLNLGAYTNVATTNVATTFTVISSATTTRLRCRLSTNGMTL